MRGTRTTGWRRIASALWPAPADPQIFGALDIDAAPLREFLAEAASSHHHVTVTTLVGRAVAHALEQVPEMNVQIRGGRAIPRESIDVFFITSVAAGTDLSGVKIEHVDQLAAIDVARELAAKSQRLKSGDDADFAKTKRIMDALPPRLLRLALHTGALVTQGLHKDVRTLGLRHNPFGSAMVSSIGTLGLPQGFAPLAWMYDVPLLTLVGELVTKPVAVAGKVEVREILPITATIDHRYADGAQIGRLIRAFREYLEAPAVHEPRLMRQ
ncbi:MAG: 2-oxo acid dehydrogenase subunit E2 [Kofleriaceae bacterium]